MPLVVDASAIVPLALSDEDATYSNAVLTQMASDGMAFVPPIFWEELTNVLVTAVRRDRLQTSDAEAFLQRSLQDLPVATVTASSRLEVMRTAQQYGLSSYDATYLTLAIDSNSELATHDQQLIQAAGRAGVDRFLPVI